MMELIKVNFIKHPSGRIARHDIYRRDNGQICGMIIPLDLGDR